MPRCFGIDFEKVSLADVVTHQGARADLRQAEAALAAGDLDGAFDRAAVALKRLLDDYTRTARGWASRSPFEFIGAFDLPSAHMMGLRPNFGNNSEAARVEAKLMEYVEKANGVLEAMQDAMKVLTLGLGYRRYERFERLTPDVFMTSGPPDYPNGGLGGSKLEQPHPDER